MVQAQLKEPNATTKQPAYAGFFVSETCVSDHRI